MLSNIAPCSRDNLAERVIQATTPSLKEHLSSPDLLLEFVQSLDASAYKFWNEPKDTVTLLIHTLFNNNIPTNITATIKEIRYVSSKKLSFFPLIIRHLIQSILTAKD
jgi:hypothetical protein